MSSHPIPQPPPNPGARSPAGLPAPALRTRPRDVRVTAGRRAARPLPGGAAAFAAAVLERYRIGPRSAGALEFGLLRPPSPVTLRRVHQETWLQFAPRLTVAVSVGGARSGPAAGPAALLVRNERTTECRWEWRVERYATLGMASLALPERLVARAERRPAAGAGPVAGPGTVPARGGAGAAWPVAPPVMELRHPPAAAAREPWPAEASPVARPAPPAEDAWRPASLEGLTEQVLSEMDRRIVAHRERLERIG